MASNTVRGLLTCLPHQLPTAADDASYSDVFSHLEVLNVMQSTPARPEARKPAWPRRLVALVAKSGEICRLVISIATAIICLWPAAVFSQNPPDATPAETQVAPDERFEGYLFLDADGIPLPFQSDEAIERYLATASLVSMTKIPVGVSDPRKLLLAGEGLRVNAVFKDIDLQEQKVRDTTAGKTKFYLNWRDWFGYDIAAYRLDRLLDLNRVPPVIERKIKRNTGSVQIWLQGVITETVRRDAGYDPPNIGRYNQQKEIIDIFDNLVANRDSNLGNTLIDANWRLWFIDCSRCFESSKDLLYPEAIQHCERDLFEALKALDQSEVKEQLSPFLTDHEIEALFVRRDKIVDHIQKLIDEWGEIHILFDIIAADATAPWAQD